MNLNQANLIGRVTKDPEVRALPSGAQVVNFGMATNRTYKKDEEKKEEVEFHSIVAFGKLAEIIGQYVKKGQLIYISGRLQTRSWEKEGKKQYKTEIVAEQMQMGPKAAGGGESRSDREDRGVDTDEPSQAPAEDINPDDIPF